MGFIFNENLQRKTPLVDWRTENELQKAKCTVSSASYTGVRYTDVDENLIDLLECLHACFGSDTTEEIHATIRSAVTEARNDGITNKGAEGLECLLEKNRNRLGIKLGSQPPPNVRPLSIRQVPNAEPYRNPQGMYSTDQRVFFSYIIR